MKKPSNEWREFGQLIDIVDIRIGKQVRLLDKLKKERQELAESIKSKWLDIETLQSELKVLNIIQEKDALTRLFRRREGIKSKIESIFFEASLARQDLEELDEKIHDAELEKKKLEKRKDALTEMRVHLL
ncbi:hypothetical protein CGK66_18365 [Vibrio parahaemolyticus]|uniref:hypothetical protein n=2 Tax=Vibrio parahaemolyticus TaxID=670 RepID=UPI0001BC7029|nr:hypothetical protein [Vibrio parahaemolyticus]EFO44780.1 conserved hypothetical protein [Vibrio parahaemolyticus AQ4037]TNY54440.1 hypothetical protein CGK66_18365 [Vibrio parahaemolyticus]TNY84446.1 hypothetical protein CGK59_20550 [Vibrio parahaemolyticus]